VLIQYYKDGRSWISEHSDKTLDIKKNTNVVNMSIGASRIMILKNKRDKEKQKIKLKNNSLFVLGWDTNKEWVHSIKLNKRDDKIKEQDEIGPRISLTFRTIATFIDKNGKIFGQGARKIKDDENPIDLLKSFSLEH
jgi:alkylated DNA repair dioxygenase AlkB